MLPDVEQTDRVLSPGYWRLSRLLMPVGLSVLLFGLLVWPGLANGFGRKIRLSTLLSVVSANPDIAAAGNYMASVWSEGYNNDEETKDWGRVYLKSADVVSGWEARILVSTAFNSDVWGREPRLAFDPSNTTVHVVWAQATGCSTLEFGIPQCNWSSIQYAHCDLGGTDTCPVVETVASGLNDASTPDVAVDSNGDVHVVWRTGSSPSLGYAKRVGTDSWSVGTVADSAGRNPVLAYSGQYLYLVWDAGETIQYWRDNDATDNIWSNNVPKVWNPPLGYEAPGFPAIGAGEDALYVVWAVKQTGSEKYALAYASSFDGGIDWAGGITGLSIPGKDGTFMPLSSQSGVSYLDSLKPDVVVTGTGTSAQAHVVWHSQQSSGQDRHEVRYTYLAGSGGSWLYPPINVWENSALDSGDPAIAIGISISQTGVVTHVVFMEDASSSGAEVWYVGDNDIRDNDENRNEGAIFMPLMLKNSQ